VVVASGVTGVGRGKLVGGRPESGSTENGVAGYWRTSAKAKRVVREAASATVAVP
jgi:hypothetical protein